MNTARLEAFTDGVVANKCPLHKLLTGEIRLQTTLTPP